MVTVHASPAMAENMCRKYMKIHENVSKTCVENAANLDGSELSFSGIRIITNRIHVCYIW